MHSTHAFNLLNECRTHVIGQNGDPVLVSLSIAYSQVPFIQPAKDWSITATKRHGRNRVLRVVINGHVARQFASEVMMVVADRYAKAYLRD